MAEDRTEIVEGTTTALVWDLYEQGSLVGDCTGVALTLELTDRTGAVVSTTGKTAYVDATRPRVSYTPGASDINGNVSPYRARWVLTDAQGKVSFVPSSSREVWHVITR